MRIFASKLASAIREYLEYRNTLGYGDDHAKLLSRFDAYCYEYHPDIETLTKESVCGWISHELSQAHRGIPNKAASVRALARYIGNGAYILPKTATVKPLKRKAPYILTDDELSRLFVAADSIDNGKFGKKGSSLESILPTLLRLMYTCGLRPQEARLVKRDNINFTTGEIFIEKAKSNWGHKERIVVMSDDMLKQCKIYDTIRAIANPQSKYFFVRADGAYVSSQQLTLNFKRCWRQANPDTPSHMLPTVRPYDLRHRFASSILQKWINEGRDLYAMLPYLRAYMGHENFSDTAYYIHLLPENLLNSPGVDWSDIDLVCPEVDVWKN